MYKNEQKKMVQDIKNYMIIMRKVLIPALALGI